VDVAAEPIELRDDDRALQLAGRLQSRGKLRPALKRVSALASFDFGESIYDVAALRSDGGLRYEGAAARTRARLAANIAKLPELLQQASIRQ
jgi:hypothetical protein